ncbi:TIR domain-containing protein [Stenotrophomonas lactitubi]|uniref:TIR domain-containing protein n=1 Tax=Stenotrophomonas lactitubi TaxID=2045214 RepID=UPI003209C68E
MAKRQIFYSFHFNNDVMRVQQVRNMGLVEGNAPVSVNDWETIKKNAASVERWIDSNMKGTSCVIVLIGTETHKRPWVNYEIKKAWEDGKGLLGIHIHRLNCPNNGTCTKGASPFDGFTFRQRGTVVVPAVYDPKASDAYGDINSNLATWVETAIAQRKP